MIRAGMIQVSGPHRTSDTTRSMRLVLCGGGGGGAASKFGGTSGPAGLGGDALEIRVDVEPSTDYRVEIGQPGYGSNGMTGGGVGGDTIFYLNDLLALVARGGHGGRESGVHERGQLVAGNSGGMGGIFFEEFAESREEIERAPLPIARLIA